MQINQVTRDEGVAYTMEYPTLDEARICRSSMPGSAVSGPDIRMLVRPGAVRSIFEFIQWGEMTEENRTEQAGLMYGYIASEGQQAEKLPRQLGVICGIIRAVCDRSTQTEGNISAEEWNRMELELDRLNTARRGEGKPPFQKMGWFHTHPNWLDPFYSVQDVKTQPSLISGPERYGAVFNPHRQKWAVYAGPESVPVCGVLELDDELIEKYSFEERSVDEIRRHNGRTVTIRSKREQQNEHGEAGERDGESLDLTINIETFCTGGEYPPRVVGHERNCIFREAYDRLTLAPQLFGGDCMLLAEVFERARGLDVQPVAGYRRGYETMLHSKYCIIRFVPYADWSRAIREYYRNRRLNRSLPVLLISPDERVCILKPMRSELRWI